MIKNLTRQLNEAGKIKIGKKGKMITSKGGTEFRPPKKLDHFEIVTTEKNQDGDFVIDTDLQDEIKNTESGIIDGNGNLIGLPIRLLYNDTELNFPHRYVSYVGGKLSCHGDGESSHKGIDNYEKQHPCPCARVEPGYDKKDKCKPTGTLVCVIDEAGLFGQAHKFRTTSMNTIKGILGGIELIKTATNGKIAGLPLMLTMNAKQTTTPGGIATTIYIVSVCYRGSMSDLRNEVLALMSTEKQYLLSMDDIEDQAKESGGDIDIVGSEDEQDYVEEFFPDAVNMDAEADFVEHGTVNVEKVVKAIVEEQDDLQPTIDADNDSAEKIEIPYTHAEASLIPAGQYGKIYDQFFNEKDFDKAMTLAKRLQKGNLVYWLVTNYRDVEFDPKTKKPELLDIVENILKTVLAVDKKEIVETVKEPPPFEPDNVEKPGQEETGPEKPVYPQEFDESGPIEKTQLRKLVELKLELETAGVLQPDKWVNHVNYFLDTEKVPIDRAINLTTKQGDTFIATLSSALGKK